MIIKFFHSTNGREPVVDLIKKLSVKDRAKLLACLESIEKFGFHSSRVEFRQIRGSLWELKIKLTDSSYRIFYVALQNNILIMLHMYKKQSQKAPKKEIEIAEKRMKEVLTHESNYT